MFRQTVHFKCVICGLFSPFQRQQEEISEIQSKQKASESEIQLLNEQIVELLQKMEAVGGVDNPGSMDVMSQREILTLQKKVCHNEQYIILDCTS